MFSLRIEPAGYLCAADGRRTLMEAALAAGIQIPVSCRNGSCRTCASRMLAGRIRYSIEWPGLTREEKEEGWVLPCAAYPEADIVLEVPAARTL
jgi:ferredoxin